MKRRYEEISVDNMNNAGVGEDRGRGRGHNRGRRSGGGNGNARGGQSSRQNNWRHERGRGRGTADPLNNDLEFPPIGTNPSQAQQQSNGNFNGRGNGNGRGHNRGHRGRGANAGGRGRGHQSQFSTRGNSEEGIEDSDDGGSDVSSEPRRKKRERKHVGPVFGFKRLYNFLQEQDPEKVLFSINLDKDDWKDLLESEELNGDKLIVAIQVIGEKICVDVPILLQLQTTALNACCSEKVTKKMEDIVSKFMCGLSLSSRRNPFAKTDFEVDTSPFKVMNNLFQLCQFIMKTMPNNGVDYFHGLITKCIGGLACRPVDGDPDNKLMGKFKALADQISEMMEKKNKLEERKRQRVFNDDDFADFDNETPPDHIKDIEIIPTIDELRQTSEAFLRPNKTTGAYIDCDHYLDVQFRLLREDFVQPLRKGVQTFRKGRHDYISGKKRMPLGEVRLYTNVQIIKVEKDRDSVVYKLQLSEGSYKRVKWDKSKRLLIGSLIVLTTVENSFQTGNTYFGVVFNRKVPELEKGIVTVAWEGSPPMYDEDEEYLMFESEVYLEAYRYTLDTLKKLELETFPMKKFIVEASNDVGPPLYLKNATSLIQLKMADGSDEFRSHDEMTPWPTADEFGFDENQLRAFRAAVTKEFSIIQGPPGTGKTFLGLKVAETLLNNSELWTGEDGNPITVVCYTNHALDQFLEGILKYYHREEKQAEIIRIGGRCKSEALSKFSLWEVRRRNRRKLPSHYYAAEKNVKEEINDLEEQRSSRMNEVTGLQDLQGIIDFERLSVWKTLQPEFPSILWQHLQNLSWLSIDDNNLKHPVFSEERVTREMFQVRQFPKTVIRKKKEEKQNDSVQRTTLSGSGSALEMEQDNNDEDEEDFDLDELMDSRLVDVDEILLEAETSQRMNMGRRLAYLPDCSIKSCEKRWKDLNKSIQDATKGLNVAQTIAIRSRHETELTVLQNRKKLLTEIFRLYKEQYLDLPDVTELLKDIKGGATVHFNRLRRAERWALYFAVTERARILTAENVAELEKDLSNAQRELRNIIQWGDGLILRDCKVVGLTTTGAAKYNNLLRAMKSKIVIVEEAAEVFEAHIVTCITQFCEQLILIGDHRQLRPSPTVYDLAQKYHLDLSLFERMINNNLHCYQLKLQHRMRPDISNLVVGTIYDELYDHESVKQYPDVKGLTKNVFFISHTEKEKSETDSTSKSNEHEAKFIAALCRYLILQGYEPNQITVLTMYTGQMFLLKKKVQALGTCKGVRITCVDNFQGEENDIILLSLVRSNSEGKIGFLSIENRICVSVSRAKHGLYIIGNMDMMEGKSKTWKKIKQKLEEKDHIGSGLELECQNHQTRSKVQYDYDFNKVSPEGGCTELCNTTLSCTHKCKMVCHVVDKDHVAYRCQEPCLKLCANKAHACKGRCSQQCPRCTVVVERTLLCEYQHKARLPCYQKVESVECNIEVEKTLPCGHKETLACRINVLAFQCNVKVTKKLPCNHERTLECHVDPTSIRCKIMAPKLLPCLHTMEDECWKHPDVVKCDTPVTKKFEKCGHEAQVKCSQKDKPMVCRGPCTTRLECGHQCVKLCHVDDDPHHRQYQCKKDCSKECRDNHKCKVKHQCFKDCPPCKEMIMRSLPCGHEKRLECAEDINKYECLEKCQRALACGHACPNLCFQPCGPCQTKVRKRANCGHDQKVLCGEPALKNNCEELVKAKTTPNCGHKDTLVPCKVDTASAEDLVQYCQRPCDHTFTPAGGKGCDHKCMGTCSKCFQGRIHMKCQSKCGKQLVCGHRCEVPCSAVCPPCQKPCLMKCEHTECKKKCGEPCSECKEKCTWVCPHARCNKLCGELCDRDPCNEPCPKKLKCGHACVGFCGEPCPPLCRICDNEQLTEIVFGNEDEEDARFVYLTDCRHTIEADALDTFLNNCGSGAIKAKECPLCKTPIRNCRRFNNLIRKFFKDVITVKMRSLGNRANSERMRDEWIGRLGVDSPVERIFPQLHGRIREKLVREDIERNGRKRFTPLMIDEFAMRSLEFIAKSALNAATELLTLKNEQKLVEPQYGKVLGSYRKTLNFMFERHPLSRQEVIDFNAELDRVDYFKQLLMRRSIPACNPNNARAYPTYLTAKKYVVSSLPLTPMRKETFLRLLGELDDLLRSGLGITDREKYDILQAMGMSQGHWFKCPNGHIYLIGDCGGAMMESRCNECGAAIGGGQHRLRADNELASEMDGAQRAAWPTAMQH